MPELKVILELSEVIMKGEHNIEFEVRLVLGM